MSLTVMLVEAAPVCCTSRILVVGYDVQCVGSAKRGTALIDEAAGRGQRRIELGHGRIDGQAAGAVGGDLPRGQPAGNARAERERPVLGCQYKLEDVARHGRIGIEHRGADDGKRVALVDGEPRGQGHAGGRRWMIVPLIAPTAFTLWT